MSKNASLTEKDVLRIAELANLKLTDAEVEKYLSQLSETINYVENLDELDTSGVKPTSHSTNLSNVFFKDGTQNSRLLTQEEVLQNGKNVKRKMFVVPRIME